MIDIHSHIIFGVDDGAKTREDTRALLQESYNQGVKTIIATPHRRKGMFETDIKIIKENFEETKKIAKEIGEDLKVYLGSEVYYTEGIAKRVEENAFPTLAESDYLLLEFAYEISYKELYRALNKIILTGVTPVVAHIERYSCLEKNEKGINDLINLGCYMQINASSVFKPRLVGDSHKRRKKRAKYFLDKNLVHFIATDMHNLDRRPPLLKDAYEIVEKQYGKERAEQIFKKNQEKLIKNEMV